MRGPCSFLTLFPGTNSRLRKRGKATAIAVYTKGLEHSSERLPFLFIVHIPPPSPAPHKPVASCVQLWRLQQRVRGGLQPG